MTPHTRYLVYPDGEQQEVERALRVNAVVDLNGQPLQPPLNTTRMIAYRVCRVVNSPDRREDITRYYLELLTRSELEEINGDGLAASW